MAVSRTDPDLIAVARGDRPADLLLRGGRVVNVFTRTIDECDVAVFGGRIAALGPGSDAATIVDLDGACVAPGFIDAHMHIESTMMPPARFAQVALPHGTTGVVLDPHEIANVSGLAGIRYLMDAARDVPMSILFAASSCVPCSPLETAGATLGRDDLASLFDDERVVALAEMMNVPGVVHAVPEVLEKVALGLERRIVDGHCPQLGGRGLQAYVAAGIGSDHESTTAGEAAAKLALGMQIYIREGSAARNLEALLPLVTPANAHLFCFCTDDRHPADLIAEGHIDHVVRRAIGLGLDPVTAIAIGSFHTARHFRQDDLGAVTPGRLADLVVFDRLDDLRPRQVYHRGRLVAEDGRCLADELDRVDLAVPAALRGTVHLPDGPDGLDARSFRVPAPHNGSLIRVIGLLEHQLITEDLRETPAVRGGEIVADVSRDLLKLAVIERHHGTGNIGLGFVRGFGLREGALASTVGHDSHNITVVGASDEDMTAAVRALAECGGGQCVARGGEILALLPLPIAGLLSEEPPVTLVAQQRAVLEAAGRLGCPIEDPFMPLSFLPLTVIPALKLSDRGLVDVGRFEIVPLQVPGP